MELSSLRNAVTWIKWTKTNLLTQGLTMSYSGGQKGDGERDCFVKYFVDIGSLG